MTWLFPFRTRLIAAVALISLSLISYQVAIMQLLSLAQWYHYANMVISIALLGFGTAGTCLSLLKNYLTARSDYLLPLLFILSGASMVAAVWLSQTRSAYFDSYLLFVDRKEWLSLLFNYFLFLLPYFFGGLALGIIFIKWVREIGLFYFYDLAGAACGAMLAAVLAWYFLPSTFPVLISLIACVAGVLLLKKHGQLWLKLLAGMTVLVCIYSLYQPVDIHISQYKSLSRTLNLPAAKVTHEKPGPYGFVQVVSAEALRYAPGLSLRFTGEIPVRKAVFNNADWYGPLVTWSTSDSAHLLDYTTIGLPYALQKRKNVLVLQGGTGLQVSHALSNQAESVDVVEPHKGITSLMLHQLTAENDSLYYHRGVSVHVMEPRSFLSVSERKYALIALPMVGTFGGNSGLYAMREEYSLTKEAFLEMWQRLETDGVISVTAWMDYPFRNPLKVAATLAEVAEAAGVRNIYQHISAIRSWGTVTFLLKKTPHTATDISRLKAFCDSNYFDPLLYPGIRKEERSGYNGMNDDSFFEYIDVLLSPERRSLYDSYDFYLQPATDNHPYFSQFLRWKSLPHLADIFGNQSVSFLELGWIISVITFLQSTCLALILIMLPLFKLGWKKGSRLWTFLYFSGLGIGYMFLEILFIQKFILFFGNPVYTVTFVIAVMLLSSGAGSFISTRLQLQRFTMQKILLTIFLTLLVYFFFLSDLLRQISGATFLLKAIVSVVIIVLPALFMGMPFPLGLSRLSVMQEEHIPWAWGINGCMSVIGASLATLLAVEAGFSAVMLMAAMAYAVSFLAMFITR